jgi:DNA invertase Pin-like site-specific DNA recombinase
VPVVVPQDEVPEGPLTVDSWECGLPFPWLLVDIDPGESATIQQTVYAIEVGGEGSDSGAGLEAQRRAIAAACERCGWQPLVEDAGRSAQEVNRPGVEGAVRVLERADERALVAAKQGRLSQALLDLASLLATAQQQGWALVALDCALEPTTPAGEETAYVLATFAPLERGLISQRTKEALARKRSQGARLGRPATMPKYVIDRIKRERAAGKSLAAIANGLNADRIPTAQGGQRWYPTTIRHTLNRTT